MMNHQMDEKIAKAITVLKTAKIVEKKEGKFSVDHAFRGQIAAFGAAVTMGSLCSAVAFFSKKGSADVDRQHLMDAIYMMLTDKETVSETENLLYYVTEHREEKRLKEEILMNAAALKLAMNAYYLEKNKTNTDQNLSEKAGDEE